MSQNSGITATLKKTWTLLDGSTTDGRADVEAGRYELERIPCPYGHPCDWLVIKGTKIGMAEGAWRQWQNGTLATMEGHPNFGKPIDWGEFEIVIEG